METNMKYVPIQVVWELTLKCNLKCIHCGSFGGKPRNDELSLKESLELIRNLKEIDSKKVCFMGGEPFLHKEWYKLGKEVKNYNMELLFISNGSIINKKIISKLRKLEPYGISMSLDGGLSKTHDYIRGINGSFDKILNSISLLQDAGLPIAIITTVNKLNFKELPMIRDLIINKNIAWQIQTASPEGRFPKNLLISREEFYSLGLFIANLKNSYDSKKLPVIGAHCCGYNSANMPHLGLSKTWDGCQAGKTILSIKSNGDVIGCLSIPSKYIEGNIRKRNIVEIWNDSNSFKYNRKFKKENLGDNCLNCKYGNICMGGCMGMSCSLTRIPHNDPYCYYKIEQEFI